MGLAEVLVAGAVGSIIIAGSMKSLTLSLQTAQIARSSLTETELKFTFNEALKPGHCESNLRPEKIKPTSTPPTGLGTVDELMVGNKVLIESGKDFKGDIRVVRMEMRGPSGTDPTSGIQERNFILFYKKNNLGQFSSKGGLPCSSEDQSGCFIHSCRIHYGLTVNPDDSTKYNVSSCSLLDCQQSINSSGCAGDTIFFGHDPWTGRPICAQKPPDPPVCSENKSTNNPRPDGHYITPQRDTDVYKFHRDYSEIETLAGTFPIAYGIQKSLGDLKCQSIDMEDRNTFQLFKPDFNATWNDYFNLYYYTNLRNAGILSNNGNLLHTCAS